MRRKAFFIIPETCNSHKSGIYDCQNTDIKKGDRIFLLRYPENPGIIAAGYAESDCSDGKFTVTFDSIPSSNPVASSDKPVTSLNGPTTEEVPFIPIEKLLDMFPLTFRSITNFSTSSVSVNGQELESDFEDSRHNTLLGKLERMWKWQMDFRSH